ncbi:hypothetical protein [Roseateles sp.]|uniref:hypothetical protein n=1 Tax=Roseateles sp. TaxID=1971397 RepID=UPI0039EB15C4
MSFDPPSRQNSAGRIEVLVLRSDGVANLGGPDGWAEVFGISEDVAGVDRHHAVAKLLSALTEEIRMMERQLKEAGVPDDLLLPTTHQLAQSASIGNLANNFHNIRSNHFGSDVRLSLRWFKHTLPEETIVATADDLAELEQLLAEVEGKVAVEGIPESLAVFVRKQIAAIRDALRQYPIGGPVALKRATRAMAADIHLDEDEIRQASQAGDPKAVAEAGLTLRKAWDKAVVVAGDVEKFSKAGQGALSLGTAVYKLLTNG